MRTSRYINRVIHKLPPKTVRQNEFRLKTSVVVVKYIGREGLVFRGRDESIDSSSWGHFIELVKSFVYMNE